MTDWDLTYHLWFRDLINIVCTHLELYRAAQAKIAKKNSGSVTFECRDAELKLALAAENKLHPALFSAEAEHKVFLFIVLPILSN